MGGATRWGRRARVDDNVDHDDDDDEMEAQEMFKTVGKRDESWKGKGKGKHRKPDWVELAAMDEEDDNSTPTSMATSMCRGNLNILLCLIPRSQ